MNHTQLIASLALHLSAGGKLRVWTEIPLGSVFLAQGRIPRADVLTMVPSFVRPIITIYEVKHSLADFRHDTNSGKYLDYLKSCNRIYFACEAGLIKKEEVPDKCGLITHGKNGWGTVKGACAQEYTPDSELLIKLAIEPQGVRTRYQELTREERLKRAQDCLQDEEQAQRAARYISRKLSEAQDKASETDKAREELRKMAQAVARLVGYEFNDYDLKHGHYHDLYAAIRKAQVASQPEKVAKLLRELPRLHMNLQEALADPSDDWHRKLVLEQADALPKMVRELLTSERIDSIGEMLPLETT